MWHILRLRFLDDHWRHLVSVLEATGAAGASAIARRHVCPGAEACEDPLLTARLGVIPNVRSGPASVLERRKVRLVGASDRPIDSPRPRDCILLFLRELRLEAAVTTRLLQDLQVFQRVQIPVARPDLRRRLLLRSGHRARSARAFEHWRPR